MGRVIRLGGMVLVTKPSIFVDDKLVEEPIEKPYNIMRQESLLHPVTTRYVAISDTNPEHEIAHFHGNHYTNRHGENRFHIHWIDSEESPEFRHGHMLALYAIAEKHLKEDGVRHVTADVYAPFAREAIQHQGFTDAGGLIQHVLRKTPLARSPHFAMSIEKKL